MCVAFIKRTKDKMLIALNRDEFYRRPTQPLSWLDDKGAYAGLDLKKGGTWFALDKDGRFALVTNIRRKELYREEAKSRGELPFKALANDFGFLLDDGCYNPFNLVWGDRADIRYFNSLDKRELKIDESLFAVSNGVYPATWPKAKKGVEAFKKLSLDEENLFEKSFDVMKSSTSFDFVAPDTGFSEDMEKRLSPIFIEMPEYGTVSTTVALVSDLELRVEERLWPKGTESKFHIQLG